MQGAKERAKERADKQDQDFAFALANNPADKMLKLPYESIEIPDKIQSISSMQGAIGRGGAQEQDQKQDLDFAFSLAKNPAVQAMMLGGSAAPGGATKEGREGAIVDSARTSFGGIQIGRRTVEPTAAPTTKPTPIPTQTLNPTVAPTLTPTATPTLKPTMYVYRGGTQVRHRSILMGSDEITPNGMKIPEFSGRACPSLTATRQCNTAACPTHEPTTAPCSSHYAHARSHSLSYVRAYRAPLRR